MKVYRAFPEFDRFTDEQCRRILAADRPFDRTRVTRELKVCGLAFGAAALPAIGIHRLVEWLQPALTRSPNLAVVVDGVALTAPCLLLLGLTLGFRDWLVRRDLRRLINTRGSCAACRYVLLGLPASEESTVACPECGLISQIDPTLGELAVSNGTDWAAGTAGTVVRRFTPKQLVEKPEFWTTKRVERLKRWAKRGAITALAVVVLGGGFALYRFIIADLDASAAKAMYDSDNLMMRHIRSVQPEGTLATEPNGWDVVLKVYEEMQAIDAKVVAEFNARLSQDELPAWTFVNLMLWNAERVAVPAKTASQSDSDLSSKRGWNTEIALAREALRRYEQAGLFRQLDTLGESTRYEPAIRQADWMRRPASRGDERQLKDLWTLGVTRLRAAIEIGDEAEGLRAVKSLMSLHRRMICGIGMSDFSIGLDAIAMLNTAIGPFLATASGSTLAELASTAAMDDLSAAIRSACDGHVVSLGQCTAMVFSEAANTRWGLLSLQGFTGRDVSVERWLESRSLGGLKYNLDETAAAAARFVALSGHLPRDRHPTGGSDLRDDWIDESGIRFGERQVKGLLWIIDELRLRWTGLETRIALERYRRLHDHYPPTLDRLVPDFMATVPQEPWTAGAVQYRVLLQPDRHGRRYVLYSFGDDGIDEGRQMKPDAGREGFSEFNSGFSRHRGDIDLNPADVPTKFNQ